MHKIIEETTKQIIKRSATTRSNYLKHCEQQFITSMVRTGVSCSNLAHACAAQSDEDKEMMKGMDTANIGIVSAYNDILSAHHTFKHMPDLIIYTIRENFGTAQVAAGVPAMCDGITQGQSGMELSLFSRDVIALSTAVALSHNIFDGVMCLGICDKIVPGLLIGALRFGHLPCIFVPGGPMPSGISNKEKNEARKEFAKGTIDEKEMLDVECSAYHSPGTCTFYGTANSNQVVMEFLGMQLPGTSFVPAFTDLRDKATQIASLQMLNNAASKKDYAISQIVDEKAIVNAIVGLLASGGSTNHTIHLIAMARAAGIILTWEDFAAISSVVPVLAKIYPNGEADINDFHHAGGTCALIKTLLEVELLHDDVMTIMGKGLNLFTKSVMADIENTSSETKDSDESDDDWGDDDDWGAEFDQTEDTKTHVPRFSSEDVIANYENPFSKNGGIQLLSGNVGKAIIKTSAISEEQYKISAPARIFNSQHELIKQYNDGQLKQDFVAVLLFQGPKSNGMPELHKLMTILSNIQDEGYNVALLTDGRLSGASGSVPAAIHLSPEALDNDIISKIHDGDMITLDVKQGIISLEVDKNELPKRTKRMKPNDSAIQYGLGRELFTGMRDNVTSAEEGASFILPKGLDQ